MSHTNNEVNKNVNKELRTVFEERFRNMKDLLFQRLKAGILQDEMETEFTEDDIDGKIEFSSHAFEDGYNLQRFGEIFQEKIDLLTAQIFSALDKGIKGNRMRIGVKEGNLASYITVNTAPHKEPLF